MTDETYKRILDAAKSEIDELMRQRDALNERISKLSPIVEYLTLLCQEKFVQETTPASPPSVEDMGLTDAMRSIFRTAAPRVLVPTMVRDELRNAGFNLDKYVNEMPPIHNTLKRLVLAGEIEPSGTGYKWVSVLKRTLLESGFKSGHPLERI